MLKRNLKIFSILFVFSVIGLERPKWIDSPSIYCKDYELCAVGVASGKMNAETTATNNIAKIFKVVIKSNFNSTESNDGAKSTLYLNDSISESTNEILEGVSHPIGYDDGENYFSLALIDKRVVKKQILFKANKLKIMIESISKKSKIFSKFKVDLLLNEWSKLNLKYLIVSNSSMLKPVSKLDLKKIDLIKKKTKVNLYIDSKYYKKNISELLINKLKEIYVFQGTRLNSLATHILLVKLETNLSYLKVKGFLKYDLVLNIKLMDKYRKVISVLNYNKKVIGRNKSQINKKVVNIVSEIINKNIYKLDL